MAIVSSSEAVNLQAPDEGMLILSSSTPRTECPNSSLPGFVMSVTSVVVPSNFFFFDFGADQ